MFQEDDGMKKEGFKVEWVGWKVGGRRSKSRGREIKGSDFYNTTTLTKVEPNINSIGIHLKLNHISV